MGEKWWRHGCMFVGLSCEDQRRRSGDARYRTALAHIAEIPPALGHVLDERGAPLRVCKWIGWAEGEMRHRRYEAAVCFHEEHGRWPSDTEITALSAGLGDARRRAAAGPRWVQDMTRFHDQLDEGIQQRGLAPMEGGILKAAALSGMGPILANRYGRKRRRAHRVGPGR